MQRVATMTFENGALIEVLYYPEPLDGEDSADRIHLLVMPQGEKKRGWIMTIEEADFISMALDMAAERARADGVPETPRLDE